MADLTVAGILQWVNKYMQSTYSALREIPAKAVARLLNAMHGNTKCPINSIFFDDTTPSHTMHNRVKVTEMLRAVGCVTEVDPVKWGSDGLDFVVELRLWRWLREQGEKFPIDPTYDFTIVPAAAGAGGGGGGGSTAVGDHPPNAAQESQAAIGTANNNVFAPSQTSGNGNVPADVEGSFNTSNISHADTSAAAPEAELVDPSVTKQHEAANATVKVLHDLRAEKENCERNATQEKVVQVQDTLEKRVNHLLSVRQKVLKAAQIDNVGLMMDILCEHMGNPSGGQLQGPLTSASGVPVAGGSAPPNSSSAGAK